MKGFSTLRYVSSVLVVFAMIIYACSRGGGDITGANPCNGVTITVTGNIINPTGTGTTDGSITVTVSGSTGITFSINGSAFQSSGTFANLTAGFYTIMAMNGSGCSGSASFTLTPPSPCSGTTIITVNATITSNTPCVALPTATITSAASGGVSPYTYSINGGAFQSSGTFNYMTTGGYTITAKDANGCTGNTYAVVSDRPAGPLFSAVKALMQTQCVSCHNSSQPDGGMNFTIDCNIVANKTRIKARAVDGYPTAMPPIGLLPVTERQKISNWINAGGQFTN